MADRSRTRALSLVVAALAVLELCIPVVATPQPRLVYNASASAPLGFYRTADGPIRRGDFVLARLPEPVARLAAARGYLPITVPVVKRVAALAGDVVCADFVAVTINDRVVAKPLAQDGHGRALPSWQGCRTLAIGDVFLLMEGVPASFDGRYFGPIPTGAIIARLVPLWTW